MAAPSPLDPAVAAAAAAAGSGAPAGRRPPPPCWSHDETLALIDSYRDKWLALRRSNLRASHWDEVAAALAARLPSSKTSVQCRHKIEKLRKRYRAERRRSLSLDPRSPPSSSWVLFDKLHSIAVAPATPAAAAPLRSAVPPSPSDSSDDDDRAANGRLRFTIPKAVRSRVSVRGPSIPNPNPKPRFEKRREEEEEQEEEEAVREMVRALRMLGDGIMRIEKMKMDVAREMEKLRMEMELQRTEMILDSQRQIVEGFVKGWFEKRKRGPRFPRLLFPGIWTNADVRLTANHKELGNLDQLIWGRCQVYC